MATRTNVRCFRLGKLLLVVTLIQLFPCNASAQNALDARTPPGQSPGDPAGAYSLSGFESVNLFNGNLNFRLPLLSVSGRGSVGYVTTLPIEQRWTVDHDSAGPYHFPNYNWWTGLRPGFGPGVLQGRQMSEGCNEGFSLTQGTTRLTFTASDGTEYELRDQIYGGQVASSDCNPFEPQAPGTSRGTTFVTADGSAATFVSDSTIHDHTYTPSGPNLLTPSGHLLLRDGTRYRIDNGLVTWMRDRNGNKLSFTYEGSWMSWRITSATDSLNRQITYQYAFNDPTYGVCDRIIFKGFGGAQRIIRIFRTALQNALISGDSITTYYNLFPTLNGSSSTNFNPDVVSMVRLPDTRTYQFFYNHYGELGRVELPSGGRFEYSWAQFSQGMGFEPEINRRVTERRAYTESGALASRSTYGSFVADGSGTQGTVQADHLDFNGALLAREKYYFHGHPFSYTTAAQFELSNPIEGREFKTEFFDTNGTTVLRRVDNNWTTCTTLVGTAINPCVTQTTTTLEPATTNLVTKQTFAYDIYNNQVDVYEYGFGTGAAGSLVRRTHSDFLTTNPVNGTNYATTATIHQRALTKQVQIFDSGGVERARSTFEYDNYASDANHASLVNRSSISGLDSSFTTSYGTRGNATATTQYLLNTSGGVTGSISAYQYDIAGNVVKVIDGRGHATNFDFADRFGAPDGNAQANSGATELGSQVSYAFATKVTNALSHIAYSQFDYYLGKPVDAEDANGFVTSLYYNDFLDRPTQARRAVGTAVSNQTTFAYDDGNRIVTTSSDRDNFGDNIIVSKRLYDGLGRTIEARHYEGGTNYIATQTQYDALGRPFKSSNPFRPWQSQTAVWTTQAFDALGRVISVTTPDSAALTTSYSGNSVTVTDQAGKARKSVTDALGRLLEVYEDPAGLDYQTTYNYDVLDNLVKVTQGSQQRFFMYDSLKRLIRARNPEQSTNAGLSLSDPITGNSVWSTGYQYDANSNLTQKTDARGVVSVYAYDAVNRNTTVDYSDTATINPDVKRFYDGATNGKGRFWYFYTGGDFSTGSNVDHTSVDSYDALGRPLVQRQLFKLNGVWGPPTYQMSRGYNRAGSVTSQTYPSGRTVSYSHDSAGRTSSFIGNLGDGVSRTYATGITYSQWGNLSCEQFGTNTAVYNKLHYNIRGQLCDVRASNSADEWGGELGALVNYYSTAWAHCGSGTDNNGNVLMSQTIINSYYMEDRYSYDALNRLTAVNEWQNGATHTGSQQYTYDRWGNRTINPVSWGTGINTKQFTVDTATNRLGVPGGQTGVMNYDAAGNVTNDTYTSYGGRTYDAENKMTAAQDSYAGWSYYTYNAEGQRTRRKINNQETWQVYGFDGELLAEYAANAAASSPQREYGYRNGQLLVTAEVATNVALAANGATVTASSTLVNPPFTYPVSAVNNGDRKGLNAGYGGNWHSSTATFPQWVQVDFSGSKSISEVNIFSIQDNYSSPIEPTEATTFSLYGLTGFEVQYWNGSAWATVLGGTVTGNNKVWKKVSFAPVTTSKIRVLINATSDNWSRMVEVEAWTTGSSNVKWLVADHLGTPRMILDQTGTLANIKRHDYLPFGEELYAPAGGRSTSLGYTSGDGIRQQFSQKERDVETGLDYFGARYYSSLSGRFSNTDDVLNDTHLEEPQSWNLYTYVRNSPLRFIDPDGQIKRDAQGKVIFVKNREETVEFKKNDQLKINGQVVRDQNGRAMTFTITWKAEVGTVYADDGTEIQATRATGEMEITVQNGAGEIDNGMTSAIKNHLAQSGANNATNCHGQTFASGQVWINNSEVGKIIQGDGYAATTSPRAGDVGIYTSDGNLRSTVHSVSVNSVDARGNVTDVVSKGGITARINTTPGPGRNTAWQDPNVRLQYFTKRTQPSTRPRP